MAKYYIKGARPRRSSHETRCSLVRLTLQNGQVLHWSRYKLLILDKIPAWQLGYVYVVYVLGRSRAAHASCGQHTHYAGRGQLI